MKTEIRDELKEIATSLAGIGNENCYRVPENYFEDIAGEIMGKIQLPATKMPFTAPGPGYFEGLAGEILHKIKGNGTVVEEDSEVMRELTGLSPLVANIKKVNVYSVPAYYFANFKVAIPTAEKKSDVKALHQPVRWIRYAAAAVIIGVIAASGFFLLKSDATTDNTQVAVTKTLSAISDDAIANYLKESPAEMDITPAAYDDDTRINTGNLTEQLLDDVSDADIQNYLQENKQSSEKDIKGI